MKKIDWKTVVRRIFPLPAWLEIPLFLGCGAALIWVFVQGLEKSISAYVLYALSAYLLTAICIKLPSTVKGTKNWLERHHKIKAALKNKELHFKLELYFEQCINFAYGIFKIVSGVVIGSAWIGADGIYNFTQAMIQLFQILRRKKPGSISKQWKSYRLCGVLMLLMHLTLIGIVFQMVNWNRVEEHGEIMIIATAAFAFYKMISSFIDIARDRKHTHPVDSSVRMMELSQAFFAIFSLQAGLLHTFGTGESWEHWMNLATGCAVCLLVSATGVYMIRRGSRELRKIQEKENG
ncbi:MAG: hypothetical protein IKJ99_06705 [Oscillospiraceae bacterium]|nr:hypothetical protein [Oscillospiraceae bacterium]